MWRHYIKTAWRNITRNRATTLINLFGLSVALVAFIFIALWVQNELSFDSYHKDAKDILPPANVFLKQSDEQPMNGNKLLYHWENLLNKAPGIEDGATRILPQNFSGTVLNIHNQLFAEKSCAYVDDNWFNMFHYDLLYGDIKSFYANPFSIALTESKAKKYFGDDKKALGQFIKIDSNTYQIKAILKDNPANSSFQSDILIPLSAYLSNPSNYKNDYGWNNFNYLTFIKISPNANPANIERAAKNIFAQNKKDSTITLSIEPLTQWHFDNRSSISSMIGTRHGNRSSLYIFSILGFLLLFIASINYVNLTVARTNARTKEIGIRKIIGGSRMQLFMQFLAESLLFCSIVLAISFIVARLALPIFNNVTERQFTLSLSSLVVWKTLLGTLVLLVLLNGIYPALIIAGFNPINFLQGKSILKFKNVFLRKSLVVVQFVIAMVFIVGALVITLQIRYIQRSGTSYNRGQVVSFQFPFQTLKQYNYFNFDKDKISAYMQVIKNDMLKNNSVQDVELANASIDNINSWSSGGWDWKGRAKDFNPQVARFVVDAGTKDMFNIQLKEGRWFRNDNSDKHNYILNETAVKVFGIKEPVIGQYFSRSGDTGQIIGVTKDFAFKSMHEKITPMAIYTHEIKATFFVKIAAGKIPEAMKTIEATWKKFVPDAPFEYQFMNQAFDNLYKDDLTVSKLVLLFSCISIIISALGLLGLAAFVAEQRTKEIGIRKVFGASVRGITLLLSKDFVKLVIIGIVIAMPVAWWAANKWLNNFAYKIHLSWWIFLLAGILVLLIAFLTISFQTIRAARANPVKSLKTE
ncbi:MAG: ABC transporter permease [Arachidicoccus sp.]|nr:ABC transporter permease [Arachidicoccus sp.]